MLSAVRPSEVGPVRVVGDVEGLCPAFHTVGYQICHFAVDGNAFLDSIGYGFVGFPRQVFLHFLTVEDMAAVVVGQFV